MVVPSPCFEFPGADVLSAADFMLFDRGNFLPAGQEAKNLPRFHAVDKRD
jgi:hypothetical protein